MNRTFYLYDPTYLYPWSFICHYIIFKCKWHAFFFYFIIFTVDIAKIILLNIIIILVSISKIFPGLLLPKYPPTFTVYSF